MIKTIRIICAGIYSKRWLLTRRTVQLFILLAFLYQLPFIGNIATGNLSSSEWFDKIPLTDPFILLQSFLAGSSLAAPALIGALILAVFYAIFGGRIYCSWVCPINMLTDAAYWLRQRLNLKSNLSISKELRKAILFLALLLSFSAATLAWEIINPITLLQRELMWASMAGSMFLLALFFFDLLVSRRGWCGHLCPVGAFYGFLGHFGRLRVTVNRAESCAGSSCSACMKVCPEPHVLVPVVSLKGNTVVSGDCTRCGACLDKCSSGVLSMKIDLSHKHSFKNIPIVTKK
ncbi:quinol dehydrogenase ferredoxin subunit NapH [Methylophaga muralis]|uniref:Putative electron transport protein YccM n=1 Tax=Methylophaga muralis TaxID=291169 RepID=A0A1E3GSB5_9GAMM|nr:quinol dehydrogenase ferredoxin subunit NapH [Methylophaga muralis]ODN66904.1 putative electron transport protein YccM [Methylophaga muralis]